MAKRLIKVNGVLLKALHKHYGLTFDYEDAKKFIEDAGFDVYGNQYSALIERLIEHGYAKAIIPNTGEHKGHKRIYLSAKIDDLVLFNNPRNWKRGVYWLAVTPLWFIIPVGVAVTAHSVLSLLSLREVTNVTLTFLVTLAYIGLLGAAYLYQNHRKRP